MRTYTERVIYRRMNLSDYVKQVGARTFAEKFGITERAALAYQYGTRRPRARVAQKIVKSSPVTWEGIYGSQTEQQAS